jgi:hypothetical protein
MTGFAMTMFSPWGVVLPDLEGRQQRRTCLYETQSFGSEHIGFKQVVQ